LTFIPGSTTKLEQLVGDEDKETHKPTLSRTNARYKIWGTDLGFSFEHEGRVYFLFGDTLGALDRSLDTIAVTSTRDPEEGVRLDFLMDGDKYLTIQPRGISMGSFEVPVSGIDIGGQMYVIVRTHHSADWSTDRTVLTKFTPPAHFEPLRTVSQRFLTMSIHAEPAHIAQELPPGGPYVLCWATATYRASDLFLFLVPVAHFETGEGTLYFAGPGEGTSAPKWSPRESDAAPVLANGHLGDVSVIWNESLGLWLMTYDERPPQHVSFRDSRTPWGPWSPPQQLFLRSEGESFIHNPERVPNDGLGGPKAPPGGVYAPYMIERWTKLQGSEMNLYYTLSTWVPYVPILMKSSFRVD
jgi:hypothetical protein